MPLSTYQEPLGAQILANKSLDQLDTSQTLPHHSTEHLITTVHHYQVPSDECSINQLIAGRPNLKITFQHQPVPNFQNSFNKTNHPNQFLQALCPSHESPQRSTPVYPEANFHHDYLNSVYMATTSTNQGKFKDSSYIKPTFTKFSLRTVNSRACLLL